MKKIVFNKEQEDYVKEHFPNECASDIAEYLGVSSPVIFRIARELGLKKADGWNRNSYCHRYVNNYPGYAGRGKKVVL